MDQNVERRIRDRAYSIWEEEGRPEGRDVDHWLRAAQEIAAEVHGEEPPAKGKAGGRGKSAAKAEPAAAEEEAPKKRAARAKTAGSEKAAEPAPAPKARKSKAG